MFRFLALLLLVPWWLGADDKWTELRYGPFLVFSSLGEKQGREQLNRLEQYRNALGQVIGKQDPGSNWPIVLVVAKKPIGTPARFRLSRDTYISEGLSPDAWRDLGKILLDANGATIPASSEKALLDLYSTLEVDGTHVTLGAPPEPERRTLDWARLQFLSTDPRYSGRLRVFLYNLGQTSDPEPAYKNAFGHTPPEIEQQVKQYFAAGKFATADVNARAVKPERDFLSKAADPARIKLLEGDLLLAAGGEPARVSKAYTAAGGTEAKDGIALATLRLEDLKSATGAGSTNARVWFEYGRKIKDPAQALAAFQQAGKFNPKWYAPAYGMSQLESDPKRKSHYLAAAAKLEPRSEPLWEALATAYTQAEMYSEATHAWATAERNSPSPEDRERIRQLRNSLAEKKLDQEAAARRAAAEAKEREVAKLREETMTRIREAEARVNQGNKPLDPATKVVPYSEIDQENPKLSGTLERVECLDPQARLHLRTPQGIVKLLVRDPSKAAINGKGSRNLVCGPQRAGRKVTVEYKSEPDSKFDTAGDVVTITYQ